MNDYDRDLELEQRDLVTLILAVRAWPHCGYLKTVVRIELFLPELFTLIYSKLKVEIFRGVCH